MRALLVVAVALAVAAPAAAGGWSSAVPFSNQVAGSPFRGGGYPVPEGSTAPLPGTCRLGEYDANRSESWLAVKPGSEDLVGTSKVFFERYSTYYMFHLGSYTIPKGKPAGNNIVQGYECVTTGSQDSPPTWTNNTDPNVAFDTQGRAYQVTLPFNMWWGNGFSPDAAIGVVYSDDLGRTWVKGNGGAFLDKVPMQSSKTFGGVEDKQWVAVNQAPLSVNRDHVYAAWAVFNGFTVKIKVAVSRDRGETFSKPATLTSPSQTGPATTYVYPAVDAAGDVYIALAAFPACCSSPARIYVTRSVDDGRTWGPFVQVASTPTIGSLPNTTFRDGIVEHFAASPTYPGHLYLVYEAWDGTQMDVKLSQSTDAGLTWTASAVVNDNVDAPGEATDQFQPSVAAGPGGAVAVAFYDRRLACPSDPSVLPADVGRQNFCIDVSLQAYKDSGAGAVPVGGNVRLSKFTWDPEQPRQTVGGIDQYACAGHTDPCPAGRGFIGDYFGLAVSTKSIYTLSVSTHYPSSVVADAGGPVYYQQQVLATVARSAFGPGY
ncbi:MAG: sialidase family protein [Gaiellaceae bacterium]